MENTNSQNVKNLDQLKLEILADGIIDATEVKEIETILFEDGIIDEEEAEWLFELNDAVSDQNNHPSWGEFFAKAIGSYLLHDEESPGEIDEAETEWLLKKIQGDGQIDSIEMGLLKYLQKNAQNFPSKLNAIMR